MSLLNRIAQGNRNSLIAPATRGVSNYNIRQEAPIRRNAMTLDNRIREQTVAQNEQKLSKAEQLDKARKFGPVFEKALELPTPADQKAFIRQQTQQMATILDNDDREDLLKIDALPDEQFTRGLQAFHNYLQGAMPKGEPFTLGKDQVRYSGSGDVLARGPTGTTTPKPPTSRTVTRGTQTVTEEWDEETGKWNQVGTGPRFQDKTKPFKVENQDINTAGRVVAGLFDGVFNISTGEFSLKDDADRRKAFAIHKRAIALYNQSKGEMLLTDAIGKAAKEYGVPEAQVVNAINNAGTQDGGQPQNTVKSWLEDTIGRR